MNTDYFKNRNLVITTNHKKESVIAPLVERELSVRTLVPKDINTDALGTFTREIPRKLSQFESARAKSHLGLTKTGETLGLANEGAFDVHPSLPFVISDIEVVVLIDTLNAIEITGFSVTPDTQLTAEFVTNRDELIQVSQKLLFPSHGVILRKSPSTKHCLKDISSEEDLIAAFNQLSKPWNKRVFVEPDRRAHRNPTRMQNIEKATLDLIENIKSQCPQCGCPGFVVTSTNPGLPCSRCMSPTEMVLNYTYSCQKCGFSELRSRPDGLTSAPPSHCEFCNP